MTLQDYIKVFRHRWPVIVICALVAGAITWLVTPASADTTKKVGSYTATATVVVGTKPSTDDAPPVAVNLSRVVLYLTTGEVPKRAAAAVKYDGDVVIESFTTDVKVIARAAAIWRKIEPSSNDIAVKGLKFLQRTLR